MNLKQRTILLLWECVLFERDIVSIWQYSIAVLVFERVDIRL